MFLRCTIGCSLGIQGGTQGVAFHPEDRGVCSGACADRQMLLRIGTDTGLLTCTTRFPLGVNSAQGIGLHPEKDAGMVDTVQYLFSLNQYTQRQQGQDSSQKMLRPLKPEQDLVGLLHLCAQICVHSPTVLPTLGSTRLFGGLCMMSSRPIPEHSSLRCALQLTKVVSARMCYHKIPVGRCTMITGALLMHIILPT